MSKIKPVTEPQAIQVAGDSPKVLQIVVEANGQLRAKMPQHHFLALESLKFCPLISILIKSIMELSAQVRISISRWAFGKPHAVQSAPIS